MSELWEQYKTCGEISCDECNERYEVALKEIDRLTAELAEAKETINEELLLCMEMAIDLQNAELENDHLIAELSRYRQGVEVEGCITATTSNAEYVSSFGITINGIGQCLPIQIGQRVRVLVRKGEEK